MAMSLMMMIMIKILFSDQCNIMIIRMHKRARLDEDDLLAAEAACQRLDLGLVVDLAHLPQHSLLRDFRV